MRGHACPGSESVPRLLIATAIALVLVACALKAICCSLIMLLLRPEGSPTSQRLLILDVLLLCSVCSSLDLPVRAIPLYLVRPQILVSGPSPPVRSARNKILTILFLITVLINIFFVNLQHNPRRCSGLKPEPMGKRNGSRTHKHKILFVTLSNFVDLLTMYMHATNSSERDWQETKQFN